MPEPDYLLGVGSGTHGAQTARASRADRARCSTERPDVCSSPGDVNSTLAGALAAAKLRHPRRAPRGGTAQLRPDDAGGDQPRPDRPALGPGASRTARRRREPRARGDPGGPGPLRRQHDDRLALPHAARGRALGRPPPARPRARRYLLVTLHRPTLVDGHLLAPTWTRWRSSPRATRSSFRCIRARARSLDEAARGAGLRLLDPVGYVDFLALEADARGAYHRLRRGSGGDDVTSASPASRSATTPSGR